MVTARGLGPEVKVSAGDCAIGCPTALVWPSLRGADLAAVQKRDAVNVEY